MTQIKCPFCHEEVEETYKTGKGEIRKHTDNCIERVAKEEERGHRDGTLRNGSDVRLKVNCRYCIHYAKIQHFERCNRKGMTLMDRRMKCQYYVDSMVIPSGDNS